VSCFICPSPARPAAYAAASSRQRSLAALTKQRSRNSTRSGDRAPPASTSRNHAAMSSSDMRPPSPHDATTRRGQVLTFPGRTTAKLTAVHASPTVDSGSGGRAGGRRCIAELAASAPARLLARRRTASRPLDPVGQHTQQQMPGAARLSRLHHGSRGWPERVSLSHRITCAPCVRRWMRRLHHPTIFILIAGTHTSMGLMVLPQPLGTVLLTTVWVSSLAGINLAWVTAPRWLAAVLHLRVGWIAVAALLELVDRMNRPTLLLLALGRAVYSAGAAGLCVGAPESRTGGFRVPRGLPRARGCGCRRALGRRREPRATHSLNRCGLGPVSASIRPRPGASQGLPLNGLLMPSLVSLTAASARSAAAVAAVCPTIRSTTPYSTSSAALIQ
jgi:hypothetical protein